MLLMLRKWKYKVYQWNRRCSKNKESQGPHYSKTIWPLNIIFWSNFDEPREKQAAAEWQAIRAERQKRYAERVRRRNDFKKKDDELKNWLKSLGLENDDVIRLKCCYNFVQGNCTSSEVIWRTDHNLRSKLYSKPWFKNECKYVHPEPNVDTRHGMVLCCFNFLRDCCKYGSGRGRSDYHLDFDKPKIILIKRLSANSSVKIWNWVKIENSKGNEKSTKL